MKTMLAGKGIITSRTGRLILVGFVIAVLSAACIDSFPMLIKATATMTATIEPTIIVTSSAGPTSTPVIHPTATSEPPTEPSPTETVFVTPTLTIEPGIITPTDTATSPPRLPYPTRTRIPSKTPTITPTPTPPFAHLHIYRPGLLSRIISPYRMEAMVEPGEDGLVKIELFGEDNRVISSQLLDYSDYKYNRFWTAPWIDFNITAAAEIARLVISVDDQFNRKIALSSVELILLYVGRNDTTPSVVVLEPYLIRYPHHDQVIEGGAVWVSGLANPVNEQPLILELIDERREIIGSIQIQVPPPSGVLSHSPFGVEIPYSVNGTTPVRLTIRQESAGLISGTVALSSMLIILEP